MDALSLMKKFLREMSLGILFATLGVIAAAALLARLAWNWANGKITQMKGKANASFHGRQPHRCDNTVVY